MFTLLDLFCGAGGCAKGYQRAGFHVRGVDIKPQPRYCGDEFIEGDALDYLEALIRSGEIERFDAVHASPPCQAFSSLKNLGKQSHKERFDLIEETRTSLRITRSPYVIENVSGAPLEFPVTMCGQYFGLRVRRHRLFESNILLLAPDCERFHSINPVAVYGDHPELHTYKPGSGGWKNRAPNIETARAAMGIDWMIWPELTQAIPPAYTEFIGKQLIEAIRQRRNT